MTDILLQHGGNYITADRTGLELMLTYSFEPKRHEDEFDARFYQ